MGRETRKLTVTNPVATDKAAMRVVASPFRGHQPVIFRALDRGGWPSITSARPAGASQVTMAGSIRQVSDSMPRNHSGETLSLSQRLRGMVHVWRLGLAYLYARRQHTWSKREICVQDKAIKEAKETRRYLVQSATIRGRIADRALIDYEVAKSMRRKGFDVTKL